MADLKIYRAGAVFRTVKIGLDTTYQGQFMGENKVLSNFFTPSVIKFQQGDYIIHKGQEWRLNEMPSETRNSRNKLTYNAVFEGREYTWNNKQVMHLGVSDFSYFGTPLQIIQLLVSNINEIDPGWLIGTVDNTAEPRHFPFKDISCRQGLTMAAEEFGMEFAWNGRTIDFKNTIATVVPDVTLSYGIHNGLYSLTRQPASDARVATRVYGYGSTQNIPADYRGGLTRLTFAERKIDNNIELYGVIEASVTFDDIRPERTASITGTANATTVTDTTLDFDLNSVIIKGQAKIVFQSGSLQGNEFLITSYNHASRTIKFEANKEENGTVFPSGAVKPNVGDKYTLIGIIMPQTYITAAEARVKQETTNFANSIKTDNYLHQLAIDQIEAKANGLDVSLKLGYKLHVVDTEMGVDETLRVQALSYPLINPAKITATITDKVTYTRAERVRQIIAKQEEAIREIIKGSAELQRISAIRREELQGLIFDPDGYFDTGKIKPLSINTSHIAVGSRSQEYSLSVIFKPNADGLKSRIDWTAGVLTHFTIEETIKTWNIALGSKTAMVDNTAYYIYARCSKAGTTGTIVLDTVQRKADSDANFYYFLVGVLSSVIDGIRWPTLTYGTTEINGGFVRTGRIESNDGKAYLDLTTSQFYLGDTVSGMDWSVTKPGQLTIRGVILTDGVIIGDKPIIDGMIQISLDDVSKVGATTTEIITAKGVRAQTLLELPDAAPLPADRIAGKTYIYAKDEGHSGQPIPGMGNLEELQNVADTIANGMYLFKGSDGIWKGASIDLNGFATQSWVNSGFVPITRTVNGKALSGNISLNAADVGALSQSTADGLYVTLGTKQTIAGAKNFSAALGIPAVAPIAGDRVAGVTYIYANGDGSGSTPAPILGNLEDLANVASTIANGMYLFKGTDGIWKGQSISLAGYALESWVTNGFEPKFAKNTGFNKNFGSVAGTVMEGNDTRVVQAYGWGDHKTMGYWNNAYIAASGVSSADANTVDPNGGFTFSYSSNSWLANSAFNHYGGIITFKGNANRGALQIQYGVGHEGETASRLAFRTEYGTTGGAFRNWKEIWHSGNSRSNADNDARYIFRTGDTINGQLFVTGYSTFSFLSNRWYTDNTGADVLYFGSANNANGILFKASYAAQQFQLRDANSGVTTWINMTDGSSSFSGPMLIGGSSARRMTLKSVSATGNNYIEFQNSLGVRTAYLGQASSNADAMYYRIDAASDHIFLTNGTVRMRVLGNGNVDILNDLNLGNSVLSGSGNSLRITTPSGWTAIGPANTGWSHFSTDRPAYHFDKMLHSAEGFKVYNNLNELSASGLVANDISLQGSMTISQTAATRNRGIIGTYLTTAAAAIWAMGSSYMIDANGLSLGNLYGMAYRYQLVGGGGGMNYNHSIVFAAGGSVGVQVGLDGRLWAKTSMEAPIVRATRTLEVPNGAPPVADRIAGRTYIYAI